MDRRMNYYALEVALTKGCMLEQAFDLLERPDTGKFRLDNDVDIETIKIFRHEELMTYRQIGELYGRSDTEIYRLLKKDRERRAKQCGGQPASAVI